MTEHIILRNFMQMGSPDMYDVTVNGEHLILFQNVHGQEDGSLSSGNYDGDNEEILEHIAAFAKRIGREERWVIHPCHPRQVKERFPEYRDHILGDWPDETHHHFVFGHVLITSAPELRSIRYHTGIAGFMRDNIGDPITNAQVEQFERLNITTSSLLMTKTEYNVAGYRKSYQSLGLVTFSLDFPPFEDLDYE